MATVTTPARHPHRTGEQVVAAVLFAGTAVAVAAVGSVATRGGQDWYDTLDKPSFTPPDAAFGIVWTILYALVAVAGWMAWRAADSSRPTVAWAVQMALNLAWTSVFFGVEAPSAGLVVIVALLVAIVVNIAVARTFSAIAAALLVPYLLWVCFATALNVGVIVNN